MAIEMQEFKVVGSFLRIQRSDKIDGTDRTAVEVELLPLADITEINYTYVDGHDDKDGCVIEIKFRDNPRSFRGTHAEIEAIVDKIVNG